MATVGTKDEFMQHWKQDFANYKKVYNPNKKHSKDKIAAFLDFMGVKYNPKAKLSELQEVAKPATETYARRVYNKALLERAGGGRLSQDESWVDYGKDLLNKLALKSITNVDYKYLGAGTPLTKNIIYGVHPANKLDQLAMQHDMHYLHISARIKKEKPETIQKLVNNADRLFIEEIESMKDTWDSEQRATGEQAISWIKYKMKALPKDFSLSEVEPLKGTEAEHLKVIVRQIERMNKDYIPVGEMQLKADVVESNKEAYEAEKALNQLTTHDEESVMRRDEELAKYETSDAKVLFGDDMSKPKPSKFKKLAAKVRERVEEKEDVVEILSDEEEATVSRQGKTQMNPSYKSVPIKLAVAHQPPEVEAKSKKEIETTVDASQREQVKEEAVKKEEMRVRYTDKVITGERSMRADLTYLGGDYVKLTPEEKARNVAFYSSLNFVKEGNGNGNQQIVPFSYKGWTPNNRLIDSNNKSMHLKYGGNLNFGNQFVQTYKEPTQSTLHKYGVIGIPSNQHNQQWMAVAPTSAMGYQAKTVGQPIKFASRETQPTMHTEVYSQDRRLFHGNLVNGDPWGKSGVRV